MQENGCSLALPPGVVVPAATQELQAAVITAAHKRGLICVGHALDMENTMLLLRAGVDGLTHTFVDQPHSPELLGLYKEHGAFVIPTLTVLASLTSEEQERRERFADLAAGRGILDQYATDNKVGSLGMKKENCRLAYAFDTVRTLKAQGIDVVAGTDAAGGLKGTAIGPSLWMELGMYVEKCGFSPIEALSAATAISAKRFGFHDRGVVGEGKRADLVLVKGDPTGAIEQLWKDELAGVWREGIRAA